MQSTIHPTFGPRNGTQLADAMAATLRFNITNFGRVNNLCWVVNPANLPCSCGCILNWSDKHPVTQQAPLFLASTLAQGLISPSKMIPRHRGQGTSTKAGAHENPLLLGELDEVEDRQQATSQEVGHQGAPDLWWCLWSSGLGARTKAGRCFFSQLWQLWKSVSWFIDDSKVTC